MRCKRNAVTTTDLAGLQKGFLSVGLNGRCHEGSAESVLVDQVHSLLQCQPGRFKNRQQVGIGSEAIIPTDPKHLPDRASVPVPGPAERRVALRRVLKCRQIN